MVQNLQLAGILTFSDTSQRLFIAFYFYARHEVFAEIMATPLPLQHLKSKDLYASVPGIGPASTGI